MQSGFMRSLQSFPIICFKQILWISQIQLNGEKKTRKKIQIPENLLFLQ